METAYEVWRGVMYCVGVFVTCNVGGAALRLAHDGASALMKRRTVTVGVSDRGNAAEQDAASAWKPQSLEEMQREIGRTDDTRKPDKGADA